jgi:uncharacterized protein YndB with AHSA1/START domain
MARADWIDGEKPGDGRIRHLGEGLYEFQIERFIPRPIEKAWAALTIPERLAHWLGPIADLDLRVGGRFIVFFDKGGDDAVRGLIREYDPPRVLAFDWNEAACDLRCRFQLTPEVGGCRLVFRVWGLRETTPGMQARFVPGSSAGWRLFTDELVRSLTGELPDGDDEPFESAEARYLAHFGPSVPGFDAPMSLRGHESDPFVTAAGAGFSKLRFSRIFAPSVEKLWAALTEPARIARWYGPAAIDLEEGGEVAFGTAAGVDRGFIVALEPESCLAWARPLADGRHTVVRWDMAPWKWPTTTVSRLTLTLKDVPTADASTVSAAWMRRLHDLADAAQA